jgi:hypothetical protein
MYHFHHNRSRIKQLSHQINNSKITHQTKMQFIKLAPITLASISLITATPVPETGDNIAHAVEVDARGATWLPPLMKRDKYCFGYCNGPYGSGGSVSTLSGLSLMCAD